MIKPSTISNTTHSYIKERLQKLAKQHRIQILLAIESGSRAWGFPSQNSDYDVRFIYARSVHDYLSVEPLRDVIETPLADDPTLGVPLDLNGWDVKKALGLAMTSNLTLCEWLTSPIQYISSKEKSELLFNFVRNIYDLDVLAYRYQSWAQSLWKKVEKDASEIRAKSYFYVLRLLLCSQYIETLHKVPPMDVHSLCQRLELNPQIIGEIKRLIDIKAVTNESDFVSRVGVLDGFIGSAFGGRTETPNRSECKQQHIDEANQLFKRLISV